jgi:hypothetical protein
MSARARLWALLALLAVTVAWALSLPPIPQDPAYHDLADQRTLLGVPHFWNVVSNIPFVVVGLAGFALLPRLPALMPALPAAVLSLGLFLVGFGSAWYHLAPGNDTLFWDRLPMTIAFMALLSLVIGERLSARTGWMLLFPLLAAGVASVMWWAGTEARGVGDLRPYALVQFASMLLIAAMLLMYPRRWLRDGRLWAALGCYALAKLAEHFDAGIFAALGWISGHSIKHLLAALAAGLIVAALVREPGLAPTNDGDR